MKKFLLLLALGAGIGFGATAQNGKARGKNKGNATIEQQNQGNHENKNRGNGQNNNGQNGDKIAKNAPAKVRAAFNRDFPNASNVTWTKNRNVWTAHFNGSIFGLSSASYQANGTRVNSNNLPFRKTKRKNRQTAA